MAKSYSKAYNLLDVFNQDKIFILTIWIFMIIFINKKVNYINGPCWFTGYYGFGLHTNCLRVWSLLSMYKDLVPCPHNEILKVGTKPVMKH